ncbi:hypothetical protein [Hoylesella saccharolytica]|uniref:hypothetical protein n=1 Tax=Hoylesella saccharolytica TaxID=633701 RepID=UPI0004726810|nr:hypothetical protein [Hoylesella saccharolytica]
MVTRLQASYSRLVATVEMFPTTSADFSTPVSDSFSLFAELLLRKKYSRQRRQSFYHGRNVPRNTGRISTTEEMFPATLAGFLPRKKLK